MFIYYFIIIHNVVFISLAGKAAGGLPIPHNADKEMKYGKTFSTSNKDTFLKIAAQTNMFRKGEVISHMWQILPPNHIMWVVAIAIKSVLRWSA